MQQYSDFTSDGDSNEKKDVSLEILDIETVEARGSIEKMNVSLPEDSQPFLPLPTETEIRIEDGNEFLNQHSASSTKKTPLWYGALLILTWVSERFESNVIET